MLNGVIEKRAPDADIVISYRLEGKLLGKAPFFDAYTIASHTGFVVCFAKSEHPDIKVKYLKDYISEQTIDIPRAPKDPHIQRPVPRFVQSFNQGGLLVIPGMTRESYDKQPLIHQQRIEFEYKMLRSAQLKGRPILAICAGSWTLWQALGGTLCAVNDHNYGGGMPRISAKGKMTYNTHIHDVVVKQGSLLHGAMGYKQNEGDQTLSANSIHWMAPDAANIPANVEVAATALRNANVTLNTRQGNPMAPDENTVEAFCNKLGAPVLGILWHPEAFDFDKKTGVDASNTKALLFMAKAGNAYQAKQNMLAQLKQTAAQVTNDEADKLNKAFQKMAL